MKITVVGAGPGGYEAAIMAAKLGAEVTVVEKDNLGGTCLNRGCIPTKSLLASSEVYETVKEANKFGINIEGHITANINEVVNRKNSITNQLSEGIEFLFKTNNINLINGLGSLIDSNNVKVIKKDGSEVIIKSDKIILATGSLPIRPKFLNYDGKKVITSDEILNLENIPKSIIIVGGGVIGCEMGQFSKRMGSEVTIVEMDEQILPLEDEDVSKQLNRQFKKEKIKVITKNGIEKVDVLDELVRATLQNGKIIESELMLISIGRRCNTECLELNNAGIKADERGRIIVDQHMETNIKGIYAIGDIVNTPLLAHVASKEGIIAAENAMGNKKEVSYKAVPRCVYTYPEVASVGYTEKELKEKKIEYKIGSFDFRALGKAKTIEKIQGFAKVIVDDDDVILGASVVGAHATDLLAELTLAVHFGLTAEKVGEVIHPHPTLSEILMEALHDVHDKSIHKI